jgi:hypothetical protein
MKQEEKNQLTLDAANEMSNKMKPATAPDARYHSIHEMAQHMIEGDYPKVTRAIMKGLMCQVQTISEAEGNNLDIITNENVINYDKSINIPEFNTLEEELADNIIRTMNYAQSKHLRLPEVLLAKIEYKQKNI